MPLNNPYKDYRDFCTANLCNPHLLSMKLSYALRGLEDLEK